MSRELQTYGYWQARRVISFLVNSVRIWKASVFNHDEIHPDSLVCYSGYCLRISFPIYLSYQRGWVETTVMRFDAYFCEQLCLFDGAWEPVQIIVMCIKIQALSYSWHLYVCFCDCQVLWHLGAYTISRDKNERNWWMEIKMKNKYKVMTPGTMPLISKMTSSLNIARSTLSLYQNKLNWTNSSKKTLKKDIFDHPSHQWPHLSFSLIKNMENYDPVRTTESLMKELSRMLIHYSWSLNSSTNSKVPNISLNWMSAGDTTMFISRMEINGRPPSRPTRDSSNPPWCFSDSVTCRLHFNLWWTISL